MIQFFLSLSLFLLVCLPALAQNTLSVAGFGELAYQKNADGYNVKLADLGTFDFVGTLEPLDLQTKVTTAQLQKFAGYQMIEALELEQITLKVQPQNFVLEGQADTKKKLSRLCEAFNIQAPFIKFMAQISPKSLQFQGGLDFSASPVVVNISQEVGTRLLLEHMKLEAMLGYDKTAKPSLFITTNLKIKPTAQDKDLQTALKLTYNLLNMEILGTGAMQDAWANPLGISNTLGIKEDAVLFADAVVSMGWIPVSAVPTTLGFSIEKAKFFNLEYATTALVAIANKEIALKAHRQAMTAKDFVAMLTEGFGLKVPKEFLGEDFNLQQVDILFSPNGGTIGDVKIGKGFAYSGGVAFANAATGNLSFLAVGKDSIALSMHIKGLDKIMEAKIDKGKETELDKALKQALATLQIKKVLLQMKADKNMNLVGKTACSVVVFEKEMNFDIDGTLNPDTIANGMLKKIGKVALEQLSKQRKK